MAGHCFDIVISTRNMKYTKHLVMTLNLKSKMSRFEESNVNPRATSCSPCVCRYLVGTQRMFLLDPIQYKTEYNACKILNRIQCRIQKENLTYSYLLSLCTRVDIYNKELNLNIWRSKLSDKSKFALNMSSGNIYCLWMSGCKNTSGIYCYNWMLSWIDNERHEIWQLAS